MRSGDEITVRGGDSSASGLLAANLLGPKTGYKEGIRYLVQQWRTDLRSSMQMIQKYLPEEEREES